LVKIIEGAQFTMESAPPLPPDVTSWSIARLDAPILYDVGLASAENFVKLVAPEESPKVREFAKQADELLDTALRDELLGSLGDRFAVYSSPGDGPLTLGQVYLVRVKDAPKLLAALNKAIKGVGRLSGIDIGINKRDYHGAELREVQVRQQGFAFLPTYTIHDGWLVASYFPQPVQGFVLRSQGKLPTWQPDARTQETLKKLPREFISVSYADPRPTVRQLFAVAPMIAGVIKSITPDLKLDVGAAPNGHEATQHLFPNVSVVRFDGNTLRWESRSSLALPFDLSGVEASALLAVFAFAQFAF
jgi:hypothetical protein